MIKVSLLKMEKKMITVAILMSTFNGEKYLKEQIDSILNQKCNFKFDLFVRDDGSTDNTLSILESYSKYKIIKRKKAPELPQRSDMRFIKKRI